jgi:hypothetical protein
MDVASEDGSKQSERVLHLHIFRGRPGRSLCQNHRSFSSIGELTGGVKKKVPPSFTCNPSLLLSQHLSFL